MKGQVSAEMLILLAVVIAIVAIAAAYIMGTAEQAGETIEEKTTGILDDVKECSEDAACTDSSDCGGKPCVYGKCSC